MDYSIKPEEHELREARQTVEAALESCRYVLEKADDLTIHLGHVGKDEVGEFGVYGNADSSGTGRIYFNTASGNWKQNMNDLVIDIYGQSWFYEKTEETNFIWQQLLASTTGLLLIEQASDSREPGYNGLEEEWQQKKERLSDQLSIENRENFSWELKLLLGRKLLENYELEEFPELKRSNVIEAGDKVFS